MSPRLSKVVAESPNLRGFRELQGRAIAQGWSRWNQARDGFLEAMWEVDQLIESGVATAGESRNGKGDFFGDLLCALLEKCSGKELINRPGTAGRVFSSHALDAAYPKHGAIKILLETKVAGAPKSHRNKKSQKNPLGRAGSADLDKRVKEAALKTIDLKAESARQGGAGQGPQGDLISWIRQSDPKCFMLLAIRVVDPADLARTIKQAHAAQDYSDGCGLIAFAPRQGGYELCEVPRQLDMDITLTRICEQLRHLP